MRENEVVHTPGDNLPAVPRWAFGFSIGLLMLLLVWNLVVSYLIPKFDKIFGDMIGPRNNLPMLTNWVIGYGKALWGTLPFVVVFLFFGGAWVIMGGMRASRKFLLVAFVANVVLMAHAMVLTLSFFLPLATMVQDINARQSGG